MLPQLERPADAGKKEDCWTGRVDSVLLVYLPEDSYFDRIGEGIEAECVEACV